MVLGNSSADGDFTVGPSFFLLLTLVALVAVPVVALALGVRARRRSATGRVPSTAWATAALTVARVLLGAAVAGLVIGLMSDIFGGGSSGADLGAIEARDGSYVVAGESRDFSAVCPLSRGRNEFNRYEMMQLGCRAATHLDRARPAGATVTGLTFDVVAATPTTGDRLTFNALRWGGAAIWLVGLLALERILARVVRREPFAPENIRWLRVLAACVAAGGFAVGVLVNRFADALIERTLRASGAMEGLGPPLIQRPESTDVGPAALLVAFLILVLAEVWRFGIRLQTEIEATV